MPIIHLCPLLSFFALKMLLNFFVEEETISFSASIVQYFFKSVLPFTLEGLLLAAMAYDHHMAIMNALLYAVAMTKIVCVVLVIGSHLGDLG